MRLRPGGWTMIGAFGFTTTAEHRVEAGAAEREEAGGLRLRARAGVRAICEARG